MGFSRYFQAVIRDQVSARISALGEYISDHSSLEDDKTYSPFLALLRPVTPNILLRIGRDELSGLVRASEQDNQDVVRHP